MDTVTESQGLVESFTHLVIIFILQQPHLVQATHTLIRQRLRGTRVLQVQWTQLYSIKQVRIYKYTFTIRNNLLLLLMVSSSLYVSYMFVTRVLSSLVFRVVLL